MTAVFLSYAHDDEARVRVIERALRARGHDVFWDEDIPTGDNWREVLEDRVMRVQCVLVAWSAKSIKSKYVGVECEVAAKDGRLLPLLLEKVSIPTQFESLQAADLTDWIGNVRAPEWEKLVAKIEGFASRVTPPQTKTLSAFAPDPSKDTPVTPAPTHEEKLSRLESVVEREIRTALDLSPVQRDAFRDITSIRVRGDSAFAEKVRELEKQGYVVAESKSGEALLERKKRFSWGVAAVLTLLFVFPALVYLAIFPFLPKSHRIYVVQVE